MMSRLLLSASNWQSRGWGCWKPTEDADIHCRLEWQWIFLRITYFRNQGNLTVLRMTSVFMACNWKAFEFLQNTIFYVTNLKKHFNIKQPFLKICAIISRKLWSDEVLPWHWGTQSRERCLWSLQSPHALHENGLKGHQPDAFSRDCREHWNF